MIRQIIRIDAEKCNGCAACVDACHEGAILMREGKAVLLRDDYCDGLGNCLPVCPQDAISFEEREALPYDEAAAMAAKTPPTLPCGCPGSQSRTLSPFVSKAPATSFSPERRSCLGQWPVQIKLAPVNAPWLQGAHVLVAADCCAYARDGFHQECMAGKVTLIGCPKLDGVDYAEKLSAMVQANNLASLSVARMSVPCCAALAEAVGKAAALGKVPGTVTVISPEGELQKI